jgi:hypothetical protein
LCPYRHVDLLLLGCADGGDAAEVAIPEPVAVSLEGHQRNAKLQLTVLFSTPGPVPGLYLYPDHRRRRRRPAVRSDLSV